MNKSGLLRNLKRFFRAVRPTEVMDHTRYYPNPYGDFSINAHSFLNGTQLNVELASKIRRLDDVLFSKIASNIKKIPQGEDSSVYTGYSGIAYLLLFKYRKTRNIEFLKIAKKLVDKAISTLSGENISFLLGDAGPLALGAVIYNELELIDESGLLIQRLVDLPRIVHDIPAEVLYGYAGYLYALLWVNKELGPVVQSDFIKKIIRVIIEIGHKNAKSKRWPAPLYFDWFKTNYLGAAHGVAGILYILLCANDYLSKTERDDLIRPTIEWLCTCRFDSGNFKSTDEPRDVDSLVHWCHGSPGVCYLFILASKIYNHQPYMHMAIQCGDVVWNRGLLQKGYSLCHGVAGNAYTFIHIYKGTHDLLHLFRAACFADWCTRYPEAEGHKPDSPLSLFEGIAGLDYFLTDIQDFSTSSFPAFALE